MLPPSKTATLPCARFDRWVIALWVISACRITASRPYQKSGRSNGAVVFRFLPSASRVAPDRFDLSANPSLTVASLPLLKRTAGSRIRRAPRGTDCSDPFALAQAVIVLAENGRACAPPPYSFDLNSARTCGYATDPFPNAWRSRRALIGGCTRFPSPLHIFEGHARSNGVDRMSTDQTRPFPFRFTLGS